MKKVTALVGSPAKRATYDAVRRFLDDLQALGGVEVEIVNLSEYRIERCLGCMTCFEQGQEFCPLKDDRDLLIGKMMASDGVVIATPNYAFHASALLKTFLERLAFAFHRPRFFGKTFSGIVAQGIYGGGKIVKYLDLVGYGLGFNTVKGCCFTALLPMTEADKRRRDRALAALSRRFHRRMMQPAYPVPSLLRLLIFRFARTRVGLMLADSNRDHSYYREQGWLASDYYYPARLGAWKKAAGRFFDWIAARMTKSEIGQTALPAAPSSS